MAPESFFIVGGAGFIGSHFTDELLSKNLADKVTLYDNFTSGREFHFKHHLGDKRFSVVRGDVKDLESLKRAMAGHHTVIHLASNPDIAKAATDPTVDYYEGFQLTYHVLEAVRVSGAKALLYASGSGIYGDLGALEAAENFGPLFPISTYGASKLSGEAYISSYCHMFGLRARAFRFGNVVGPRQTHGVGLDFAARLMKDPSHLRILGDGSQSKSYIHVFDVIQAVLLAHSRGPQAYDVFNVATGDYITVLEIAQIVADCLGLAGKVRHEFTGGDRGWKGDVPVVRLNTDKIRSLGWLCQRNCAKAIRESVTSLIAQIRDGLIP